MRHLTIFACLLLMACHSKVNVAPKDSIIQQPEIQRSLYQKLAQTAPVDLPATDSASFLILPLEASCPSCRDKTLDSIIKFSKQVPSNHFILLSLKDGGKRYVKQYFKNAGHPEVPEIPGVLFLDSTGKAGELELYDVNPVIYYIANGHTYRKVDAWPNTIEEDLREFFRGYRLNTK